jgi:hypothetical protein
MTSYTYAGTIILVLKILRRHYVRFWNILRSDEKAFELYRNEYQYRDFYRKSWIVSTGFKLSRSGSELSE